MVEMHGQRPISRVRMQVMKEHAVAPVRNRDIVIVDPVRIDAHSGQSVIVCGKKLLQHIIIVKKPDLRQLQVLRPPQREFNIVIGTVKGEGVARHGVRRQDHLALVVPLLGHKPADIHKAFGSPVDKFKVHGFLFQIQDRHLHFDARIKGTFLSGRCQILFLQCLPDNSCVHSCFSSPEYEGEGRQPSPDCFFPSCGLRVPHRSYSIP